MASYSLKLFIENCGQTDADGDMVRPYYWQPIGSRQRSAKLLK